MRWGVLLIALMVAACGGGDRPERPRSAGGRAPAKPSMPGHDSAAIRQCRADLSAKGVNFSPLPDKQMGGGCLVYGAVKLLDVGVPVTNLGALTCPLAANFAAWAKYAAMPAARVYFKTELVRIDTMGTYSCRPIAGSRRLSEHGKSNAIDIAAFVLDDGRRISVLNGWNSDDPQERAFLRRIRESACKRFGTVLSPDYNAAHRDHFHFDMSGKDYCR
jgi:hypothetical protein